MKPLSRFGTAEHAEFMENGYIRLGKLLSAEALAALQQRINDIMLGRVSYTQMRFQLDSETGVYSDMPVESVGHKGSTLKYRKIMDLEQDPLHLAYMRRPLCREITRRYIGENVSIYRAMFMNKPADQGTVLPWHQDVGVGWGLDRNPITTVWTALDDATAANGCMQIFPACTDAASSTSGISSPTPRRQSTAWRQMRSIWKRRRGRRFCCIICCRTDPG